MPKLISTLLAPMVVVATLVAAPAGHAAAASGSFVISPTSLDFGQALVGSTSPRLSVTVRNVSGAPVVMDGSGGGTSAPFVFSTDCQGKTVLADGTCHMYYQFKPTDVGPATGSVSGIWNGQSYSIGLTGSGQPRFRTSPTALDFGDVPVGTTGPQQTVTITNLSAPVVMSGAGGGAGALFGGSQDCQGTTLGTGKSCHMFYRFQPSGLGVATESTSGNWNGQQFSVSFRGNGVSLPSGDFIPLSPTRVLDTRPFTAGPTANQQLAFGAANSGPVPTSALAVDVQVTALPFAKSGSLTVWPCGDPMPRLPSLRYQARTPITNHVLATFNSNGVTCVQATSGTDVLVDLDGYYTSASSFHPLTPKRVEKTTGGTRPAAGTVLHITVAGGSVPPAADAVALNLTALDQATAGQLSAYPCGIKRPPTSALQFQAHRPQSALAVSKIGSHGQVCVRTSAASHVLADLVGYYTGPSAFLPIQPSRVLNTATHLHYAGGRPTANQVVRVPVTGGAVPSTASGVVLDVTAASEAGPGGLIVYSCGQARPATLTLEFRRNEAVTNLALARVINGGKICIRPTKATQLSVDIVGWYA